MNREGARNLPAAGWPRPRCATSWRRAPPPWAGSPGAGRVKVRLVGQALTAVRALDTDTVENILADFDLAVSVRQISSAQRGRSGSSWNRATRRDCPGNGAAAAAARLAAQIQFGRSGSPARAAGWRAPSRPGSPDHRTGGPQDPAPPDHDPDQGAADRFVPLGLTVPLHHEGISGDLYLMSFAHTGSGARFIALWGKPTLSPQPELGLRHPELFPFELFTVTDDRGARYDLDFTHGGGSEWISEISLHPAPPDDIRWLEVAAPPSPAVRVDLRQGGPPANGEPEVSEATLSPGEQLLIMLAERLLTVAPQFPLALRPGLPALSPRPVQAMGAGLGDIIAGLEAVDVLSPLSPVPARLAALCASLRIGGHGIAARASG